jgi:hypothetical protein
LHHDIFPETSAAVDDIEPLALTLDLNLRRV